MAETVKCYVVTTAEKNALNLKPLAYLDAGPILIKSGVHAGKWAVSANIAQADGAFSDLVTSLSPKGIVDINVSDLTN